MGGLLLILGAGFVVSVLVIGLMRRSTAKWGEVWSAAGAAHGLSFTPDPWRGAACGDLAGEARGRKVLVLSRASRNQGHRVTAVVGYTAPGGLVLTLDRESLLSRAEKLLGARELEVGDPAFDRAFYVHSNHPVRAHATLTADVRRLLLEARPATVEVAEGQVRIAFHGFGRFADSSSTRIAQRVQAAVDGALALAEALEANPSLEGQAPLPPTHRPLLAKALGPALGLAALAGVFGGLQLLDRWRQRDHEAFLAELDARLQRQQFAFDALDVAQVLSEPDSPIPLELQRYLDASRGDTGRLGDMAEDMRREHAAKRARAQGKLEGLRARWLELARSAADPAAEERALRAEVAEKYALFSVGIEDAALREVLEHVFAPR